MATANAPFGDNHDLQIRINHALGSWTDQASRELLVDVSDHVLRLNKNIVELSSRLRELSIINSEEPPFKRRKTPQPPGATAKDIQATQLRGAPLCTVKDISFSIPVRKKLSLEILGSSSNEDGGVRVLNTANGETEAQMAFKDVEQIVCVPVPERAQLAYNYTIIPRQTISTKPPDALVFTISPTMPTAPALTIHDPGMATQLASLNNFAALLNTVFNAVLTPRKASVVDPDPSEFQSNIVQAHRKNEKSWSTKAWKGSKEGYLFPLSPGLLFGFKKPVLFFPFSAIESVSYTNVLQRTFNMVLTVQTEREESEEVEFAMLDQADFVPIDEWVKKHGLHDKSLASERRAKVYGVNKPRTGKHDPDGGQMESVDEESEIQRAEMELQDAEDEEDEEDFDPGSDGESDGSGSDSEEEGESQGDDHEADGDDDSANDLEE